MKTISRFKVIFFVLSAAYLLAACGGTLPQSTNLPNGPKVDSNVVAFTGIVESMTGTEWTVSGQKILLDPQAAWDPGIAVGDEVRVEANVSADGAVTAVKVESTVRESAPTSRSVDASSTPDPVSTSLPVASSTPGVSSTLDVNSTPDTSSTQIAGTIENEIFGAVEAISADTITVNGVTYSLASFSEIKDALQVGDQVKLHVIANADGTFTVREAEKSVRLNDDGSNSNGSDDGPGHDSGDDNSNGNSNDDSSDDHSDNSNDDHGDNSNGSSDDD